MRVVCLIIINVETLMKIRVLMSHHGAEHVAHAVDK